jgi:hypothetical protein
MSLAQQKGSRLRAYVSSDVGIVGKKAFYDQVGPTLSASPVISRHGDSPQADTPHARRSLSLTDYDHGDYVDGFDKTKMQFDPTANYVQEFKNAFGRTIDDVIIAAATGTAYTGADGTTSTTLASYQSSRQLVAVDYVESGATANSGLTIGKLRRAKHIFGINDVDAEEPLFLYCSQQQITDLLKTDEVTSGDYNTIRALVNGSVNSFMGFTFIRGERGALNTSTDVRTCFAFTKPGIKLGVGDDIMAKVAERPDKRFSMYAYMKMSIGATRMEEAQVVSIACDQSP